MKIYAPNKNANGVYASVRFVDGVGETDNPRLIEWFKSHGYTLGECDETSEKVCEQCDNLVIEPKNDTVEPQNDEDEMMGYAEKEKSFEDMSPNELRQWMMENGFGSKIRNTRSKEKLLEILRG